MNTLIYAFESVVPVFIIVFLGTLLKKLGKLNDDFTANASRLIFTIALPGLIFLELSTVDVTSLFNFKIILFSYLVTLFVYLFLWILTAFLIPSGKTRGAFIQGAFRCNYAIIGLTFALEFFGAEGFGKATLLLAFIIPINNILAVIALTVPNNQSDKLSFKKLVISIFTNPLILATLCAFPFSLLHIHLPATIIKTMQHLARMTLPLALISIGVSLKFVNFNKQNRNLSILASCFKIIILPLLFTPLAYLCGFRGVDLGIINLFLASPTAISAYIMAEAMGCDEKLTANIILLTTLGSVITISAGFLILKFLNFV